MYNQPNRRKPGGAQKQTNQKHEERARRIQRDVHHAKELGAMDDRSTVTLS